MAPVRLVQQLKLTLPARAASRRLLTRLSAEVVAGSLQANMSSVAADMERGFSTLRESLCADQRQAAQPPGEQRHIKHKLAPGLGTEFAPRRGQMQGFCDSTYPSL